MMEISQSGQCVVQCVSVYTITKKFSINLKLEHFVVYKHSSDKFDIGHSPVKVKVTVRL